VQLANADIERIFREEYGRTVAVLVGHFGDIDLTEESVQDAFTVALQRSDGLELDGYYLFHSIRADLLRRLGRDEEAELAYDAAIARTDNVAERAFLQRQRQALGEAG